MSNSKAEELVEKILDKMHPIGSIYMTMDANSPSVYLGGTWEKIEARFLLASSSADRQDYSFSNNNEITFTVLSNDGTITLIRSTIAYFNEPLSKFFSSGDEVRIIIQGNSTIIYANNNLVGTLYNKLTDVVSIIYNQYPTNTTGGEATHILTDDELPSHRHNLNGRTWTWKAEQQGTADVSIQAIAIGGYPGNNYMTTVRGTNKITKTEGSGQGHNNMPPYLVVNIWKRTA